METGTPPSPSRIKFISYVLVGALLVRGFFVAAVPVAQAAFIERLQSRFEDVAEPFTVRFYCLLTRMFSGDRGRCLPAEPKQAAAASEDPVDKKRGELDEAVPQPVTLSDDRALAIMEEIARLRRDLTFLSTNSLAQVPLVLGSATGGLTQEELETRLARLSDELRAETNRLVANNSATVVSSPSVSNYSPLALTNNIDNLDGVTIRNATFSGTMTGLNFLSLTGGTLTGALTGTNATFSGTLSVAASTTFNGVEYLFPSADGTSGQVLSTNAAGGLSWTTIAASQWTTSGNDIYYNTGNVGIGTTSPYAKLSVIGEIVAANFTATSTTATSTFSNHISIATDKQYRINGAPVLSRPSSNSALIIGDHSGNARGSNAIDIQAYRYVTQAANVASGDYSLAAGYRAKASGNNSTAAGYYAFATGSGSTAIGNGVGATGLYSFSAGSQSDAIGDYSTAIGQNSIARGAYSMALGYQADIATGASNAVAVGKTVNVTTATSDGAVVIGNLAAAEAQEALSVGVGTGLTTNANRARGVRSVAVGFKNDASASGASAFGSYLANTVASSTMIGPTNSAKLTILGETGKEGFTGVGTTTPKRMLSVLGGSSVCSSGDASCPMSETAGDSYSTTRSGGAIDVAEWIKVAPEDLVNGESVIEAGEIVAAAVNTPGKVVRAGTATAGTVLGVVSTNPHLLMGSEFAGDDAVKLALAGRVPIKVSVENGPIAVGDLIAPSATRSGWGMKATSSEGATVGVSLEPLASGEGSVLALLQSEPATNVDLSDITLSEIEERLVALEDEGSFLGRVRSALQTLGARITDNVLYITGLVSDRVTTKELCIEDVCVGKDQLSALLQNAGQPTTDNLPADPDPLGDPIATDATPPDITIQGNNPAHIEIGATYNDLGATAWDDRDGERFVDAEGAVIDTSISAEHTVTYTASDTSGNVATATRTVIVGDGDPQPPTGDEEAPVPEPLPVQEEPPTPEPEPVPVSEPEAPSELPPADTEAEE